jgi:hypothetical protein
MQALTRAHTGSACTHRKQLLCAFSRSQPACNLRACAGRNYKVIDRVLITLRCSSAHAKSPSVLARMLRLALPALYVIQQYAVRTHTNTNIDTPEASRKL